MTYAKKIIALLVISLATCLAAAAQDAHAKFTLPHDTVWGKTILPAGDYSISLELGGINKTFVTSADGARTAFVAIPGTTEVSSACDKTSITLLRKGTTWSVRSVCFSELQMELYFPSQPAETAIAALPPHADTLSGAR